MQQSDSVALSHNPIKYVDPDGRVLVAARKLGSGDALVVGNVDISPEKLSKLGSLLKKLGKDIKGKNVSELYKTTKEIYDFLNTEILPKLEN